MAQYGPQGTGFRFKKKEDFRTGFHRIAAEQVARALIDWEQADNAVAVHETRKCLKRLRSLLRLVRPVLASRDFKKENARLRDIARALSASRDTQVMLETIALLRTEAGSAERSALDLLRTQVTPARAGKKSGDQAPTSARIATALKDVSEHLKRLRLEATNFDVVAPGFERSYRKGRKALAAMQAAYDEEASHEWRKRVQAHWRQLSLLSAAWPEFFEARIALARRLSDVLGQDHDLAVLYAYVLGPARQVLGSKGMAAVTGLIEMRQADLRRQALHDGTVLYADGPSGLRKRVRRYWDIAAKRSKSELVPFRKSTTGKQSQQCKEFNPGGAPAETHTKSRLGARTQMRLPRKLVHRQTLATKPTTKAAPARKPKSVTAPQVKTKT